MGILPKDLMQIVVQTNQNTKDIAEIKSRMATKEDLKNVVENFIDPDTYFVEHHRRMQEIKYQVLPK